MASFIVGIGEIIRAIVQNTGTTSQRSKAQDQEQKKVDKRA
jgi:hypothetical protein